MEEMGGVYCGLCVLLRQLEVEGAVDVVSTMERIRQQRPALLTSKVGRGGLVSSSRKLNLFSYIQHVLTACIASR